MQKAILQNTPVASPFVEALGLNSFRIVPAGSDPTRSFLTVDVAKGYIDELVEDGSLSSDEAQQLLDQATASMPADFGALVEQAKVIKLPESVTVDHLGFALCDTCGSGRFIPHGYVTLVEGDERVGPPVMTLTEGFRGMEALSNSVDRPYSLTGEQAVALFQQMANKITALDDSAVEAHIASFDDETRAAYDEHRSERLGGIDSLLGGLLGGGLMVERVYIPGLGSGTLIAMTIPVEEEPEPEGPRSIMDIIFGRRRG